MYEYTITKDGFAIGQAKGKSNAFKYIQKEIEREGNLGYWSGDNYISNDGHHYKIERAENE